MKQRQTLNIFLGLDKNKEGVWKEIDTTNLNENQLEALIQRELRKYKKKNA